MYEDFSVLLSVYNNENFLFLEEAVNSIYFIQTVRPSEIILVKDGPLDKNLNNIIKKLKKDIPILKVIGYSKNRGLGYALNYGLKHCCNELVFRMDTDDIAGKYRFEKQLDLFKSNKEISIIGSSIQEFRLIPGDLNQKRNVPISSNNINKFKFFRNPFNHMTVGFKKSIVMDVGGYLEMPYYEDYYLWMRMLKYHKGLNISDSLVYARIGNDMIGRRQGLLMFKNELAFQKKLIDSDLITLTTFLRNILIRAVPRLLNKRILEYFYKKTLRKQ
jgi:glycosyltransferase involved in cell wall biosynthesis